MIKKQHSQLSILDSAFSKRKKRSRSDNLLESIDKFVDWTPLVEQCTVLFKQSKRGRPTTPIIFSLKCLFIQFLYGLSEPALEDALIDRLSFQRFLGISFDEEIPDFTTIWKFKARLIKHKLYEKFFKIIIEQLESKNEKIDWCLVGEPSSTDTVGDVIKNGRRGSISGDLTIHGVQGHIAYPQLADNPIHRVAPALNELVNETWDNGNDFFPPTSFQISNINSGTGAHNVVPAHAEITFNLRYSTEIDAKHIIETTRVILEKHELDYEIDWSISGYPFLTAEGELVAAAQQAIKLHTGITASLETTGGTSDGRFIAPTGAQVLELGPVNESIHKLNEHVNTRELDQLSDIYQSILETPLS